MYVFIYHYSSFHLFFNFLLYPIYEWFITLLNLFLSFEELIINYYRFFRNGFINDNTKRHLRRQFILGKNLDELLESFNILNFYAFKMIVISLELSACLVHFDILDLLYDNLCIFTFSNMTNIHCFIFYHFFWMKMTKLLISHHFIIRLSKWILTLI